MFLNLFQEEKRKQRMRRCSEPKCIPTLVQTSKAFNFQNLPQCNKHIRRILSSIRFRIIKHSHIQGVKRTHKDDDVDSSAERAKHVKTDIVDVIPVFLHSCLFYEIVHRELRCGADTGACHARDGAAPESSDAAFVQIHLSQTVDHPVVIVLLSDFV